MATKVPNGTTAGTGSFSGPPLSSVSPIQVATSGPLQMSMYYGTSNFNPVAGGNMSASSGVVTGGSPTKTVTGQCTWGPDGTTHTFTNNGAGAVTTPHTNWYTPTTADIGHTYYALTDIVTETEDTGGSSGTPPTTNVSGLRNTWTLIEGTIGSGNGVTLSMTVTSTGPNEKGQSANGHLYISPNASGIPIVATWTWGIDVLISN